MADAQIEAWRATDRSDTEYLGVMEFQDKTGEWHNFEVLLVPDDRLVFGGACNAGFLESGFMRLDGALWAFALQELEEELQAYYDEGPEAAPRLICNARM